MQSQFPPLGVDVQSVTAAEFKRRLDDGVEWTVLDTRRPADFEQWKPTHPNLTCVNVPFTAFLDGDNPASTVPDGVPEGPLVTCCAKGISSLFVAKFLAREGWDVLALEDGMEGWADLYECRAIATDADVDIFQFHRPSSGCLAYVCVSGDEAAVIDPLRSFCSEYQQLADEHGATIRYVLDTHVHADHVSGVWQLSDETEATPVLPAETRDRGLATQQQHSFDIEFVDDGGTLGFGTSELNVVGLPGHTTEMTGYHCEAVFMTGDTLFLDSVARPDLEDEKRAKEAAGILWKTLQDIAEYPGQTIIAPGHASSTTAPRADGTLTAPLESLAVPAFDQSQEDFVEKSLATLPPRPNNFERIIAVNLGQETVSSQTAFELELGPNNCAVDAE
jgi:glyoxylase-like metal-dependent hydrolase (beta-lactamase superfamily II)/rhodanese-related sulfurtransferase